MRIKLTTGEYYEGIFFSCDIEKFYYFVLSFPKISSDGINFTYLNQEYLQIKFEVILHATVLYKNVRRYVKGGKKIILPKLKYFQISKLMWTFRKKQIIFIRRSWCNIKQSQMTIYSWGILTSSLMIGTSLSWTSRSLMLRQRIKKHIIQQSWTIRWFRNRWRWTLRK